MTRCDKLELVRGELPVRPARESLMATHSVAKHPPRAAFERPVVATRKPRPAVAPELESKGSERARGAAPKARPPARVVEPQRTGRRIDVSERAPFGSRSEAERKPPPPAPRYRDVKRAEPRRAEPTVKEQTTRVKAPPKPSVTQTEPRKRGAVESAPRAKSQAPARREKVASPEPRKLPGEPANRVYRKRAEPSPRKAERAPSNGGRKSHDNGQRKNSGGSGTTKRRGR